MNGPCLKKQTQMIAFFADCANDQSRYERLIELGRQQKPLPSDLKNSQTAVKGCQSATYLHSYLENGRLFFQGESDAFISAGLVALLIGVYSGEEPSVILTCPPTYLDTIGIKTNLTPSRANGLFSMHLRMRQDALKHLVEKERVKNYE